MDDEDRSPMGGAADVPFPQGGGESGALVRRHDWSTTALGAIAAWPAPLRAVVDLVLGSGFPMVALWGPNLVQIYNDGYAAILGDRHPRGLGQPTQACWPEVWHINEPLYARVRAGETVTFEDAFYPIAREGRLTDAWFTLSYSPLRDEAGGIAGILVTVVETTDRLRASARLLESERRLRTVLEQGPLAIAVTGPKGEIVFRNAAFDRQWGRPPHDTTAETYSDVYEGYRPDGRPVASEAWPGARALLAGEVIDGEVLEIVRLDGRRVACSFNAGPIRDEAGEITGAVVMFRDVTEERRMQAALDRTGEARFRAIVETARDYAIFTVDAGGVIVTWPPGAAAVFGWTQAEAQGQPYAMTFTPEDRAAGVPEAELRTAREEGQAPDVRWHLRKGGGRVFIDGIVRPLTDADGQVTGYVKVGQDVTERQATEQRLRASEAQFRVFAQAMPHHVWASRPDGHVYWLNRQAYAYTGEAEGALEGETAWERVLHPDDAPAAVRAWAHALATGDVYEAEFRVRRADGAWRWFLVRAEPVRGPDGRIAGWVGTNTDIEDRRRQAAELGRLNATLTESEARFRNMADHAPVMMWTTDREGACTYLNRGWYAFTGQTEAEALGLGWLEATHPDDKMDAEHVFMDANARAEPFRLEYRLRRHDGAYRWAIDAASPRFDRDGAFLGYIGSVVDIHERKEAEEVLEARVAAAVAEREQAQEALRRSQKMEAMGQLTGGVAHDFNNLLTPIIGALDRLVTRGMGSDREQRLVAGALEAAERAKTLVQRLLAFARRQPLQPVAVDVSALVAGRADLIGATLGPTVALHLELEEGLPPAHADANQLEMALLNLVVNARDAMPEGGRITVATSRESVPAQSRVGLAPGHYVRLAVSDTGTGMDEATRARAVEPFFSTKGVGRGTGLGLSMAHGLAAQLGGGLVIDSAPGHGTTVALLLPVSASAVEASAGERAASLPRAAARRRALLVDDEALVRLSTADMLADLGFEVLEADSGEAALEILRAEADVDLLVTDHLMPGISGAELVQATRRLRPGLPALVVSGYAEVKGLPPGLPRLVKPFRLAELAERVAALIRGDTSAE